MRGPLKHLSQGVAIYGAGDAAITVVNILLLPVYVRVLTHAEFGALSLIVFVEAYAKVISRWGLDGAFMRFYPDRADGAPRQDMTSTILWFMGVVNGLLLVLVLARAGTLAALIRLDPSHVLALRLMLVNIFLIAFTFVPFHVMRLRHEAAMFSTLTFARSLGTLLLRILFVLGLRYGITGMYLADLLVTLVLLPCMWPWIKPLLAMRFSMAELRLTLRFGLPRLPHGLASQTLDGNPRLMLRRHVSLAQEGVYQNGVTLGTGVGFFKNAFETAFAPFYYQTARQPDAKIVFSKMATYGVAVLVLLVAGTIAVAHEVILLLLNRTYLEALPVVPLVAVAFGLQGIYQLTSIGLNLTNRTEFYSAATITAALVSVGAGLLLIPRYGVTGAGVTVLVSYATQFTVALTLSQRFYHVKYEHGRLARVVTAGVVATLAALWLPLSLRPILSLLVRGTTTVAVYVAVLSLSGFFRRTEVAFLREMWTRARRRRADASEMPTDGD